MGWPQIHRLCTTAPSLYTDPEADVRFGCLAESFSFPNDSADPRGRSFPEGTARLDWISHLDRLPGLGADSPLFVFHPKAQYEPGLRWP